MKLKAKIENCTKELMMKLGLSIVKQMSPVIREAIDNPENLKFEGYIKGDEIIVKIKIKEES